MDISPGRFTKVYNTDSMIHEHSVYLYCYNYCGCKNAVPSYSTLYMDASSVGTRNLIIPQYQQYEVIDDLLEDRCLRSQFLAPIPTRTRPLISSHDDDTEDESLIRIGVDYSHCPAYSMESTDHAAAHSAARSEHPAADTDFADNTA